jgi:fatty-acyl-CoA synthase
MVLALMSCITYGASFVPVDIFNPVKVMDAIQAEKCTALHGVPTMFIGIMEHPDFAKYDLSTLRTGIMAGSPCPVKTMQDVTEKMHMTDLVIVFGQTESSPGSTMTTTTDSIELRCTTVGKAYKGVECKIVDPETGETLPPGRIGEFCARGYNIMKGYYNMPEATALAIDKDGWLHFGDLAVCDENGYYKVTGRLKDMIIRGGENIYPKELEECLYNHPKVKDVQVIGIPSKKYGEEVCACVILKDEADITPEEIKEYYRQKVAYFKVPKEVWIIDEFPMTASGKIQKFVLRDMAVTELGLQADKDIETA